MTGKSEVVSDRRYHGFADRRFIVEAELTVSRTAGEHNSPIGINWDKDYARRRDWQSSLNPRAFCAFGPTLYLV
jgi:hypothetical protein